MAAYKRIPEKYFFAAAQLAKQKDLALLPPASELKGYHTFSERFQQKIAEIYELFDNPAKNVRRTKAVKRILLVAAIIILLLIFTMSVGALRERVYKLYITPSQNYAHAMFVTTQQDDGSYAKLHTDLSTLYYPSYIPDGFHEDYKYTDGITINRVRYVNEQGKIIVYIQGLMCTRLIVDTEDTYTFEVTENGITYYCSQKSDFTNIIWTQNGYAFCMVSQLPADEALKTVKSLLAQ